MNFIYIAYRYMKEKGKEKTPSYPDRRKSVRLEINAVTRYIADGQKAVGMTRLINLGGLLMETESTIALGTKVEVHLNLPTALKPFSAMGEVVFQHNVRNRKTHAANEIGVKFTEVEAASEKLLESFTKRYQEFSLKHSPFSKEMSAFADPTILKVS